MEAGDWIAIYAAVVASAAFVWQAITRIRDRKIALRVELGVVRFLDSAQDVDATLQTGHHTYPLRWQAEVTVVNLSQVPVHITDANLQEVGANNSIIRKPETPLLPWVLDGKGSSVTGIITGDNDDALDLSVPIKAVVWTSLDKRFESAVLSPDHTLICVSDDTLRAAFDGKGPGIQGLIETAKTLSVDKGLPYRSMTVIDPNLHDPFEDSD